MKWISYLNGLYFKIYKLTNIMKKFNLFFVIIYTLFVFVSCNQVNKKGLEVKNLTQTKSESVYYIKKSDTIENKFLFDESLV